MTTDGENFGTTRTVAVVTTSIDEVLRRCNTDSENLYAESLLKAIGNAECGAPGSWTNGGKSLRGHIVQELGEAAASSVEIADGSGLSRDNKVSPRTLGRWLCAMANKPWADQFITSLAAPGEGTLEKRFRKNTPAAMVRAKSGYINGVRSLSGFVTDPSSGRRLIFVVLINNLAFDGDDHASAKNLQEEVVMILDQAIKSSPQPNEIQGGGR